MDPFIVFRQVQPTTATSCNKLTMQSDITYAQTKPIHFASNSTPILLI